MPATDRRIRRSGYVVGVDGCRAGWIAARLSLKTGALSAHFAQTFETVLATARDARAIMVDMPIGLPDAGKRACERDARRLLRPLRHASVFSPPRRPILDFADYAAANAWGKAQAFLETGTETGGGLSKQAWMIAPKIREVDAALSPASQAQVGEAHPEVAFWRLNGERPCRWPKRAPEGRSERKALLWRSGLSPDDLFDALREEAGGGAGLDDLYDACALALTAQARLDGGAVRLGDGARDSRGLVMEIWG